MDDLLDDFLKPLAEENKEKCIEWVRQKLDSGEMDILTLYTEILMPAQNQLVCWQDETLCIWKEHVRTSIIRTIIEFCYPYVVKERDAKFGGANGRKVLIGCPSEEYHEIGARMVADYFTLLGFDVVFVGANTPQKEILDAIKHVKPEYIGISVTNFYNLVAANRLGEELARIRKDNELDFKIIVGGNAFRSNPEAKEEIGADALIQTFQELKRFVEGS